MPETTSSQQRIELVLFDLGGVLQRLNGLDEFSAMIGAETQEAMWELWLSTPWVQRFERGHCSAEAFAAGLVEDLELKCSAADFLKRFETWPGRFYPGAEALVREVGERCAVACLSNTNPVHWHQVLEPDGVGRLFESRFLSFEMGHVKPDDSAYRHVLEALGLAPDSVLFLDDNRVNVEAARALGIRAEIARGPAEARMILASRGLTAAAGP